MSRGRALGAGVVVLMVGTAAVDGQVAAHYRDFQLGGTVASVSALTGVPASEVKTIHTRPASLQNLEWRRPYTGGGQTAVDTVQQIAFSFYNDQLFRLVIDYDRDLTEGMTDRDMIDAISTMYGATVKAPPAAASRGAYSTIDEESGTRVAGWGDAEYAAVLSRSSYGSGFKLIVTSIRLSALARSAESQAIRLDERDAPQRERARQQQEADKLRDATAKARLANKAAFRP